MVVRAVEEEVPQTVRRWQVVWAASAAAAVAGIAQLQAGREDLVAVAVAGPVLAVLVAAAGVAAGQPQAAQVASFFIGLKVSESHNKEKS